jgi:ATP adenylyltransferase
MDYLWTPWRYAYIASSNKVEGCVFCRVFESTDDRKNLVIHRGQYCFIILNAFPYTSGHVMIVCNQHIAELQSLPSETAQEMMALAQRMEGILREVYKPDGLNLGINVGKAAGAGVAGHIHMHVLPRWVADSNFMTVVGETRILPEALETTYERLKEKLQ